MIVLNVIGIIVAVIIGIIILVAICATIVAWVTLPFDIKDYFREQNILLEEQFQKQNTLIKKQIESLERLDETISKSSKN